MYEGQNAHETFEAELEKALEARVNYIIIEPARLSDETERWIRVGNCLHKTAVLTGLASVVCGTVWPHRLTFSVPICALSVFCTGLYTVSWNYDPCCQYQVSYLNSLYLYFVIYVNLILIFPFFGQKFTIGDNYSISHKRHQSFIYICNSIVAHIK